jgi:arylsulfatase A
MSLLSMPLLIEQGRYTMGRMFQKAGYTTGVVGKWHLGWGCEVDDFQKGNLSPGPLECGFDEAFVVPFSHNSGETMRVFVEDRQIVGLPQGALPGSDEKAMRSLPDTATDLSARAVAFIEAHKDNPFFLYYPTTNVHFPVTPHGRFKGRSERGPYGDFVVEFDWAVGEVMAALKRHGLTEDTILIVTSDNGSNEKKSNPFYRGRKCLIYEGGHRVPMIMSWPRHQGPAKIHAPLCQTDLLPTLAARLGVTLPAGAAEDGESFLQLLQGGLLTQPRKAIVHHSVTGRFAIRKGNWKLIPSTDNEAQVPWQAMVGKRQGLQSQGSGLIEHFQYGVQSATAE